MSEKFLPFVLNAYDKEVVLLIIAKYGLDPMTALNRFVKSETHRMLSDPDLEMWEFGYPGILDIWEAEQVTGDPRNSVYIRGE